MIKMLRYTPVGNFGETNNFAWVTYHKILLKMFGSIKKELKLQMNLSKKIVIQFVIIDANNSLLMVY